MIDLLLDTAPRWALLHAPALLIMVPLFLAPLLAILPSGRLSWLISIAATVFSLFCALILVGQVQASPVGVVGYDVGNWPMPIGITLRVDALNSMILLLVAAIGVLSTIFSWPTVKAEIPERKHPLFYSAFLVCFAGLSGVAITGDAFNLFVFLEISSISTYVLVALGAGRDRRALPAAFNYLIMGTLGASFYIIGVGFLYSATGTLNIAQIAEMLPSLAGNRSVEAGFAFIIVGLGWFLSSWAVYRAVKFPIARQILAGSSVLIAALVMGGGIWWAAGHLPDDWSDLTRVAAIIGLGIALYVAGLLIAAPAMAKRGMSSMVMLLKGDRKMAIANLRKVS